MKRVLLAIAAALAISGAGSPVSAHYDQPDHPHQPPNLGITAPAANSTVPTVFTLRGTVNPACQMDNVVSAQDNQNGGYIETAPSQSGGTFSYSIDTSKVLTREGLDPYTLKNGKIAIYIFTSSEDADCEPGYQEVVLNLQHPSDSPPAPKAVKKPIEVPSIVPSPSLTPSPSPSIAPVLNEIPAVKSSFWDVLPVWAWVVIGAVLGAIALAAAEQSAHAYRRRHPRR